MPTDTARLPDDLPDSAGGTPITYITLNDALNLVDQLRSVPDLVAYLDERATLPMWCRRMIGNERCLLQYYMLNSNSFADCPEPKDCFTYVLVTERDFLRLIEGKREADAGARFTNTSPRRWRRGTRTARRGWTPKRSRYSSPWASGRGT